MNDDTQTEIDEAQLEAQHMIGQIIKRTGLTPSEVARKAGISPSTLTRIYPTSTVKYTLSARTLAKLSAAFPPAAQGRADRTGGGEPLPLAEHGFVALRHSVAPGQSSELDMFEGDLATSDATRRLAVNLEPDRYFLAYMPSDCMEPRIRAGEVLIVDRLLPPAMNADVILQVGGRGEGERDLICVGQLSARSRDSIRITQTQHQSVSDFPQTQVQAIYTIIGRCDRAFVT